jgi:imidazolonepropionase-like amidohydrolase
MVVSVLEQRIPFSKTGTFLSVTVSKSIVVLQPKRITSMKTFWSLLVLLALSTSLPAELPQPDVLALTHITVIDMTGAAPKPDMTVLITRGRITAIASTKKLRVPRGSRVIDAAGQFLIPGLWDMHVHFTETERTFPMFVANGVLGIRNAGGKAEDLFRWREEVASGRLVGPRIVACGPIVDGPEIVAHGPAVGVATPAEGRQMVRKLKQQGADFIKVYDRLSRDSYFAIVDEAKKLKIPVVGHVPLSITTIEASDAGQKSIEHLGSILQGSSSAEMELRNWKGPQVKDGDYSVIPRNIAASGTRMLDTYDERKARQVFAHLVKNKTWQVPTLVTKRALAFVDEIIQVPDDRLKYIPESTQRRWGPQENFLLRYRTPEYIAYNKRLFQKELQLVGAMRRAGVPFMTGTDLSIPYVFAGFSVHDELALLVDAGFTPMEALQAATRNPAMFLEELGSHGTIERGKLANLVLLEANPLENIRNSQRISGVVLEGIYFPKEALQRMLAEAEKIARSKK